MRRVNRCCITVFELVLNSFDVDPVPVVSTRSASWFYYYGYLYISYIILSFTLADQ